MECLISSSFETGSLFLFRFDKLTAPSATNPLTEGVGEGKDQLILSELDIPSNAGAGIKNERKKLMLENCKKNFHEFLERLFEKKIAFPEDKISLILSMTKVKIQRLQSPSEIKEFFQHFLYL